MKQKVSDCLKRARDSMKSADAIMEQVIQEMCDHYCKYPAIWDREHPGEDMPEDGPCLDCPLNRL